MVSSRTGRATFEASGSPVRIRSSSSRSEMDILELTQGFPIVPPAVYRLVASPAYRNLLPINDCHNPVEPLIGVFPVFADGAHMMHFDLLIATADNAMFVNLRPRSQPILRFENFNC
jgi:hypothetical protein